jgi:hypothetical protein
MAIGFLMGFFSHRDQKKALKTLEQENRELKRKIPGE